MFHPPASCLLPPASYYFLSLTSYPPLQISNKYLVEGMDIVVRYNLFNVGDNAATGVQVQDGSFRQEDFDVVAGQTKFRLDRYLILPSST